MTDHFNSCDKSFKEALINFLLESVINELHKRLYADILSGRTKFG